MLHERLAELFAARGWMVRQAPAIASQMIDTAVGEKEALVRLVEWESSSSLTGEYHSEGRNVLEACSVSIKADCSNAELAAAVDRFLQRAEKEINDSYAVKLLRTHGFRAPRSPA